MAKVHLSKEEQFLLVRFEGDLTQVGVEPIRDAFLRAVTGSPLILIDLSDVSLIASPGITLLVTAAYPVGHSPRRLACFGASPLVTECLHRCRLDLPLGLAATKDEAESLLLST